MARKPSKIETPGEENSTDDDLIGSAPAPFVLAEADRDGILAHFAELGFDTGNAEFTALVDLALKPAQVVEKVVKAPAQTSQAAVAAKPTGRSPVLTEHGWLVQ